MRTINIKKVFLNKSVYQVDNFFMLSELDQVFKVSYDDKYYNIEKLAIIDKPIDIWNTLDNQICVLCDNKENMVLKLLNSINLNTIMEMEIQSNIFAHNSYNLYYAIDNILYVYDIEKNVYSKINYTKPIKNIIANENILFVMLEDNSLYSYGAFGTGINNIEDHKVPIRSNISKISLGTNHTLILTDDGIVKGSGKNDMGQLSYTDYKTPSFSFIKLASNIKDIYCFHNMSYILDKNNNLLICGANLYNETNLYDTFINKWTNVCNTTGMYEVYLKNKTNRIIGKGGNKVWNLSANPYFINKISKIML